MTAQTKYFEVYNEHNNLVINDSYKNLFLSRKVAGNTLPLEYMNWKNGCYMSGNFLARRIDFLSSRDEIFAAVAAPAGQICNFFIFNTIMGNVNKAYLCAAQRTYPSDYADNEYQWNRPNTVITGMTDTSDVPNDIDVFIFSKSDKDTSSPTGKKQASENAGLQIFDANKNCIYDSRFKGARILGSGWGYPDVPITKRVAIGGGSGIMSYSESIHSAYYEPIIYGYGIGMKQSSAPSGEMVYRALSCMSKAYTTVSLKSPLTTYYAGFIMFDVTNY